VSPNPEGQYSNTSRPAITSDYKDLKTRWRREQSVIGKKRTSICPAAISAFAGKADIGLSASLILMILY
jgi:hypothetical protein